MRTKSFYYIFFASMLILLCMYPIFDLKFADTIHFTNKVKDEWKSLQVRMTLLEAEGILPTQIEYLIKGKVSETLDQTEHAKTLKQFKERIEELNQQSFEEISTEEEAIRKYVLHKKDSLGEINYTLLSYKQGKMYFIALIYHFQSTGEMNLLHKRYMEKIVYETKPFFHSEYIIFSCMKGYSNDKLVKSLWEKIDGIMKKLNAQKIEAVNEGTFVSLAAYTDHWKETFSSVEKKMNMQLAFRIGDEKTKWFFGTPIIITEYE